MGISRTIAVQFFDLSPSGRTDEARRFWKDYQDSFITETTSSTLKNSDSTRCDCHLTTAFRRRILSG